MLIQSPKVRALEVAIPVAWRTALRAPSARRAFPSVKLACTDGGYAGKLVTWARTKLKPRLTLQIVKRPGDLHTFQVLPRRWVVERTVAWITRCRRTVRDYERLPEHHETIVYWAMTITMTRRLARRPRPHQEANDVTGDTAAIFTPGRRRASGSGLIR
jgi:transposase